MMARFSQAASSSSDADPAVRYSGSWVADKRSGFGEIQYASGASYTGTLDAEERYEGEGRYVSAEGSSFSFDYEGQWQAGVVARAVARALWISKY